MKKFTDYLSITGEVGYVEKVLSSLVYITGLPGATPNELVVFEAGGFGQILSLNSEYAEVLLLDVSNPRVKTRVARTTQTFQIGVGESLLGKTLDPLGRNYTKGSKPFRTKETRRIDITPPSITMRKNITSSFATGISWVDFAVPLGKGQRELVVGDRKIGKTPFLLQVIKSAASQGMVCIYTAIAKRRFDIKTAQEFVEANNIQGNVVVVASSASDTPGLVFLAPYTAMTIAEYFRDQGRDVLIILDDMTAHAKYYRELSLLANRFPGRSSYPGDIFYVHARLLERAGNFLQTVKNPDGTITTREKSITCLPVAELVMGDISGFIQTNLMAITDGHLLFDSDLYGQGRRPAINPFLSVTRVGHQAQSALMRDLSRVLSGFLVQHQKMQAFMHFGAELSEVTRRVLAKGDQVLAFLEQTSDEIIPLNINTFLFALLWQGYWEGKKIPELKNEKRQVVKSYLRSKTFAAKIDSVVTSASSFDNLLSLTKQNEKLLSEVLANPS